MTEKTTPIQQILLRFQHNSTEYREDLSSIVLTPNNNLWLASDETASIERLSGDEPGKFDTHQTFKLADFIKLPGDPDEEIDIEGLDYEDRYLWLIGSHSVRRDKPKDKLTYAENLSNLATLKQSDNRYLLARIPLVGDQLFSECPHPENPDVKLTAATLKTTKKGNLLTEALTDDPHIGPFLSMNLPAKENGFDIEGLAVYKDKIFLGLRGPVLRGWAILIELSVKEKNATTLRLRKQGDGDKRYKKYFVDLNGLGIRELCVDGKDLLILAGPTMDLDGPVKLYRLENGVDLPESTLLKPKPILDIPFGKGEDHAEGITFFSREENHKSLLVVYDSPAKERLQGEDAILADVFSLQN
ncbi:MAG TPA: DUF3616 domain-containing protein [Leptolyngbyaceae cyanobacterium]